MRSNMFANIEDKFKYMDEEEILEIALSSLRELLMVMSDFEHNTKFGTIMLGAKLGVAGDGKINSVERWLISSVFSRIVNGTIEPIFEDLGKEITEQDFKVVQLMAELGNHIAMPLLHFILSFAYIDGEFEEEIADRLDCIFGMSLLGAFLNSGMEEMPSPVIRLTGLEAEIVEWFQQGDQLRSFQEIQGRFFDKSKCEIKAALSDLCDKGVLYGGENIVGNMYGLTDARYVIEKTEEKTEAKDVVRKKESDKPERQCVEKNEEEKKDNEKNEEAKKRCDLLYEEYTIVLRKENDEKIKKNDANKQLATLTVQYENLLCLKNKWSEIELMLKARNENLRTCQTEIVRLNEEKSGLGFFSGRKKKEITQRIETIEKDIASLTCEISDTEKRKQGYNSISNVCESMEKVEQQINVQKNILAENLCTRPSNEIRAELIGFEYGKDLLFPYRKLKVGDYFKFGTYKQDKNAANNEQEIEWLVLDVMDDKALLISKYALDCQPYDRRFLANENITWETCELRKWLNNDFIRLAFSPGEKEIIPVMTVAADRNLRYRSPYLGKETKDQVFLLSSAEASKYFSSDSTRQCKATAYAVANGAESTNGNSCWWLRTPCKDKGFFSFVRYDGDIYNLGYGCSHASFAVRPALWIDLNAEIEILRI